jgi:hypothetical protein
MDSVDSFEIFLRKPRFSQSAGLNLVFAFDTMMFAKDSLKLSIHRAMSRLPYFGCNSGANGIEFVDCLD